VTEAELRSFCLAEMGRCKTPKTFGFLGELPKGPSGKLQCLKLRTLLQRQRAE